MQFENTQQLHAAVENGELPANRLHIGYQGTVEELAVEVWHAGACIFRLSRPTKPDEVRCPKQAAGKWARQVQGAVGSSRPVILDTDIPAKKGLYRLGRRKGVSTSCTPSSEKR